MRSRSQELRLDGAQSSFPDVQLGLYLTELSAGLIKAAGCGADAGAVGGDRRLKRRGRRLARRDLALQIANSGRREVGGEGDGGNRRRGDQRAPRIGKSLGEEHGSWAWRSATTAPLMAATSRSWGWPGAPPSTLTRVVAIAPRSPGCARNPAKERFAELHFERPEGRGAGTPGCAAPRSELEEQTLRPALGLDAPGGDRGCTPGLQRRPNRHARRRADLRDVLESQTEQPLEPGLAAGRQRGHRRGLAAAP
jgi:hypothetical protein